MEPCKPLKANPQRDQLLNDIGAAAKAFYNQNRTSSMPTWNQLVSDAKEGAQLLAQPTQAGGGPGDAPDGVAHQRIVSFAYLLVIIMMVTMGFLVFQGMTSNVSDYQRFFTGEGCHDLAYDAVYRITGMSLYAGCAAHHRVRENILAFFTGYRADLVPDQGTNMQYLINWLGRIFGTGSVAAFWAWLATKGKKGDDDDDQTFHTPPGSPSNPYDKRPWDEDGGDGAAGGIAAGGKRRRTRRSHKKTNKTRRRKTHSRRSRK